MNETDLTSGVFIPEPRSSQLGKGVKRANLAALPQRRADTPSQAAPSDTRTAHDTVTLSDNAEKIVNLNRGNELAAELKNAPADDTFATRLKAAVEDIRRIGRLFGETLKSAFSFWR